MQPRPPNNLPFRPTLAAPWGFLAVTLLWVVGCNNNTLAGSSRSTQPSSQPSGPAGQTPESPPPTGKEGPPGDRASGPGSGKPADKLDPSSEEACKQTLLTTGFKDPVNGQVYRMLEGEHTYCKGHKLCDDIAATARFPRAGEQASDEMMRCSGYFKTWLDERADSKKEMCEDGRVKFKGNLALAGPGHGNNLSLYTFENKGYMDLNDKAPIICVYKE